MNGMHCYYYDIDINDGKYSFVLYSNNSKVQELGHSIEYSDISSCKEAFEDFKTLIKINRIDSLNSEYINVKEINEKCIYEYFKDNKVLFYRTLPYENKRSINSIINSIYNHIINDEIELRH